MSLGTVTNANQWVTLETWDTYTVNNPARFERRVATLIGLIRSIPGCARNAARHFRVYTTSRETITIFDESPATVYTHRLECTETLHSILKRIPGAPLKPEVRRM